MPLAAAIPAVASLLGGIFGKQKAPKMADPVDIGKEADKAIDINLGNEDDIETLLARANAFTQDQATGLMEKALPGYGALSKQFMDQASKDLANPYELPQDVEQNLQRLAAERGISAGTKGEFNDFSLLRDFGVESLKWGDSRIGRAQSITQMLAGLAPRVNPLSPMSFYVTPGQAVATAENNRSAQQSSNNANAAASNYNTANLWVSLAQAAGGFAGMKDGSLGEDWTNSANDD